MRDGRGMAPGDTVFFDAQRQEIQREAVSHLSWLLQRNYSPKAALELVGNHFQLSLRERLAIVHAAGDNAPRGAQATFDMLRGSRLCIDGFNLLITLETALGGGIILIGSDGCYRDIADIHGSYSLRSDTEAAIALVADTLREAGVEEARWLFDRPVSNSGRVAALVNAIAKQHAAPMEAETAAEVDVRIKQCGGIAVTADSDILSSGVIWFDLAGFIIQNRVKHAGIVDLRSRTD